MSRTFVIAEAASTHDGDYDKALRLIDLASIIGADACKFQWVSKAERLCERRHAPEYLAAYKLIEFPRDWLKGLANYCQVRGVEFMCTVYLPEDVQDILPFVKRLKLSSFEAEDQGMLRVVTNLVETTRTEAIISLGMNGHGELWPAPNVHYLHCVSAYPTPLSDINLRQVRDWPKRGLSDHTKHPWTGGLAVALGAEIIEFHMRLHDTSHSNADYLVSRDPEEAREYVQNIRTAELMLGDGVKRVMPAEEPMLKYRVKP